MAYLESLTQESSGTVSYYTFLSLLNGSSFAPDTPDIVYAPDWPFTFTRMSFFFLSQSALSITAPSPDYNHFPTICLSKIPLDCTIRLPTISPWTFLLFLLLHKILPNTVLLMPLYLRLSATASLFSLLNLKHLFFFFLTTPTTWKSSRARERTHATTVI